MNEMIGKSSETAPWPKAIYAITLFVEDLQAAKEFYHRAFGLPIVFEDDSSGVFKFGSVLINLLSVSAAKELVEPATIAGRESGSRLVLTINVDNVDTLCAELAARGVQLLNGPMDRPWGIRTASFADPAGHIWEIAQSLAS
ncbi:MAG: VOC family protein [Anaerolineae bacterium]